MPRPAGVALGDQVPDPEISAATVLTTVMYVRLLAPPKRGPITPQVERGEAPVSSGSVPYLPRAHHAHGGQFGGCLELCGRPPVLRSVAPRHGPGIGR